MFRQIGKISLENLFKRRHSNNLQNESSRLFKSFARAPHLLFNANNFPLNIPISTDIIYKPVSHYLMLIRTSGEFSYDGCCINFFVHCIFLQHLLDSLLFLISKERISHGIHNTNLLKPSTPIQFIKG